MAPGGRLSCCFWAWESEPNPTASLSVFGKRLRDHIHIRAVPSSNSICDNGYNINTDQKRFSFKN